MASPSDMQIEMGLNIVGYPAVAASIGLVLARLAPAGSRLRQALLALAAGAGLVTAHVALAGKPPWPPIDSIGWIPIITAALAALLALTALVQPRRAGQALTLAVLGLGAATAVYYVGRPTFLRSMDRYYLLAGFAIATAVSTAGLLAAVGPRVLRPVPWIGWIVVAAGLAGCTVWSHSALLATLIGSVATTAGVIGIGSAVLGIKDVGPAPAGVLLVHLAATAVYAHLYAKLPGWVLVAGVLGAVAPIAVGLAMRGQRRLLAAAVGLLITAGAIGVAAKAMYDKDAALGKGAGNSYY